jgi:shikimate dehydrogenase
MQNAGVSALGLNWRYLAFDVHPDDLAAAIAGAKAMKFIGLNLTVPHKLLALDLVEVLDESGSKWGAVNTIRFEGQGEDGAWLPLGQMEPEDARAVRGAGFNTDADAIVRSLREDLGFEPRGASVLLLGAGGAGRVAALRLAEEGVAALFMVNRTMAKAEELAAEVRRRCPQVEASMGYPKQPVDLVLNATSLGLKESDPSPLDQRQFPLEKCGAIYDMIYRPAETSLLRLARAAGCRAANGLGMLLYQGAKALEIWSGKAPPLDVMRGALQRDVYGR